MTTRTLASGTVVRVDESGRVVGRTDQPRDFAAEELAYRSEHAEDTLTECDCSGSGLFYMGGAVVNGVYTGRTGTCFRCNGKGHQDGADRERNYWYDAKYRTIHI